MVKVRFGARPGNWNSNTSPPQPTFQGAGIESAHRLVTDYDEGAPSAAESFETPVCIPVLFGVVCGIRNSVSLYIGQRRLAGRVPGN